MTTTNQNNTIDTKESTNKTSLTGQEIDNLIQGQAQLKQELKQLQKENQTLKRLQKQIVLILMVAGCLVIAGAFVTLIPHEIIIIKTPLLSIILTVIIGVLVLMGLIKLYNSKLIKHSGFTPDVLKDQNKHKITKTSPKNATKSSKTNSLTKSTTKKSK